MLTLEQAKNHRGDLYYIKPKPDGKPLRCRVNGKCQTWKTRPGDFKLPVKYGLNTCFYITQDTAEQWCVPQNWGVEKELYYPMAVELVTSPRPG